MTELAYSLPKNTIGVEIGVCNGEHAELLYTVANPKELVLVDSWDAMVYFPGKSIKDIKQSKIDKFNRMYSRTNKKFGNKKNVKIVKMTSVEAAKKFPDEYFDWVYIDAGHLYDEVMSDLKAWYPKLKKGGMFSGHDYNKKKYRDGTIGSNQVQKAVNDFGNTINKNIVVGGIRGCQEWLINK